MTIGLASYAIWRLIRAGIGHARRTRTVPFERIGGAASGLAYAALCVTAVQILIGANSSGGTNSPKKTTGGVLDWTGGTTIVAVVGAVLICVALYQGYKGVSKKFLEDSKIGEMTRRVKRGVQRAWRVRAPGAHGRLRSGGLRPRQGRDGLRPAQRYRSGWGASKVSQQSYGPLLLGVVAAGLIGFALYSMADARYRKI